MKHALQIFGRQDRGGPDTESKRTRRDQYGNQPYADYAAMRRPIMTSGHHYAWTFATLMKAPAGM